MKKLFAGAAALALAISPMGAKAADLVEYLVLDGAEGLGGIAGWAPSVPVCGKASIFPVLVKNTTPVQQTASITIAPYTIAQVRLANTQSEATGLSTCSNGWPSEKWDRSVNRDLTVNPGQTKTFWMSIGGRDYNLVGNAHSFGFGGLKGNTPGQSWYEFDFKLNADLSFQSLWAVYGKTGGGDSNNGQNGFNIRNCNHYQNADGTYTTSVGSNVISPWKSSGGFTTFPAGFNQPICMAWGWGS